MSMVIWIIVVSIMLLISLFVSVIDFVVNVDGMILCVYVLLKMLAITY